MPPSPRSPFEAELQGLDLGELRVLAVVCLRSRLSGFDTSEIENAAQDVMLGLTETVRRGGIHRTAKALLIQIARNVAADMIRARQRERELQREWQAENAARIADEQEEELLESIRRGMFFVREYLSLRRAECVPLAEAKLRGVSFKQHAADHGVSHDQVRKLWSRCAQFVIEAVRKGRLRLEWPLPAKRRTPRG